MSLEKLDLKYPILDCNSKLQSTLFKLLAVALRVDLQKTYCCLKQSSVSNT